MSPCYVCTLTEQHHIVIGTRSLNCDVNPGAIMFRKKSVFEDIRLRTHDVSALIEDRRSGTFAGFIPFFKTYFEADYIKNIHKHK